MCEVATPDILVPFTSLFFIAEGTVMKIVAPFTENGIMHATINGHRFHLRLTDPTQDNFLWIDGASPPLVLDQIAAEFLGYIIQGMWEYQTGNRDASDQVKEFVIENMHKRHGRPFAIGKARVTRERISADLDRIYGTLMDVAEQKCPVAAGLEMHELRMEEWGAPARVDLAVTYRCNLDCGHCYMGGSTEMTELTGDQWRRVLDTLWRLSVPQVVFTGGEPTEREDLIELIRYANKFVTGLITNGINLADLGPALLEASLDFTQVTLQSANGAVHDTIVKSEGAFGKTVAGIRRLVDLKMDLVTNTTLTRANADGFDDLLRFGAEELGLRTMCCNSIICSGRGAAAKDKSGLEATALNRLLASAHATAEKMGLNLQWYSPTCYLELNPLDLGFGIKACSAASHNMTVKPNGDLLPCQSWPEPVGNILIQSWPEIWNHPVCLRLRRREIGAERKKCRACEHLAYCGGGCPLEMEGGLS